MWQAEGSWGSEERDDADEVVDTRDHAPGSSADLIQEIKLTTPQTGGCVGRLFIRLRMREGLLPVDPLQCAGGEVAKMMMRSWKRTKRKASAQGERLRLISTVSKIVRVSLASHTPQRDVLIFFLT